MVKVREATNLLPLTSAGEACAGPCTVYRSALKAREANNYVSLSRSSLVSRLWSLGGGMLETE